MAVLTWNNAQLWNGPQTWNGYIDASTPDCPDGVVCRPSIGVITRTQALSARPSTGVIDRPGPLD